VTFAELQELAREKGYEMQYGSPGREIFLVEGDVLYVFPAGPKTLEQVEEFLVSGDFPEK